VNEPRAEYERRLRGHQTEYAASDERHIALGNVKLAVVAAGLVLWFVIARHAVDADWLTLPVALYGALAVAHELTLRKRRAAQTAVDLFKRGIARIEDQWPGTGATGEEFREAEHVYAEDLDLFGRGCLFQLLSTARLPMGEARLAEWLKHGSSLEEVLERQKVVAELSRKLDLHRDLATAGESLRARIVAASVTEWAEATTVLPGGSLRAAAVLLSLCAAAAIAYYFEGGSYWPLFGVLAIEGAVRGWLRHRIKEAIAKLDCNAEGLELLAQVLERFEREEFRSERLKGMAEELKHGTETASEAARKLARIVYWLDARDNLLMKLAEVPFLYTLQVALAAEAWKKRWGSGMRRWLEIVGEMEALVSLATYAYERPADVFPEFLAGEAESAVFDGEELGHPLIASAKCVRNSVRLSESTRVLLVSGSNMSGKSTLLRTVGINAVLAMAGAPVRAARLRVTPLAVGTRIRSGDSLQEGRSNFYTEILHIRRVFDLTGKRKPLLFLFDELLDGTNSHDRRIGAEKLLRTLVDGGAIGMVTTHDLALTEIRAAIGERLKNVHFEDQVAEGKMQFDYRLREGVVTKSNAIELMRIIGLDV
jgi:MutS-like protein